MARVTQAGQAGSQEPGRGARGSAAQPDSVFGRAAVTRVRPACSSEPVRGTPARKRNLASEVCFPSQKV